MSPINAPPPSPPPPPPPGAIPGVIPTAPDAIPTGSHGLTAIPNGGTPCAPCCCDGGGGGGDTTTLPRSSEEVVVFLAAAAAVAASKAFPTSLSFSAAAKNNAVRVGAEVGGTGPRPGLGAGMSEMHKGERKRE